MRVGLYVTLSVFALVGIYGGPADAGIKVINVSWYGAQFHGKIMANGERYDMHDPAIAAHKTLPFGTKILLTNPKNQTAIVVVVKDRGPWTKNRSLDLSFEAAKTLGIIDEGVASLIATVFY